MLTSTFFQTHSAGSIPLTFAVSRRDSFKESDSSPFFFKQFFLGHVYTGFTVGGQSLPHGPFHSVLYVQQIRIPIIGYLV